MRQLLLCPPSKAHASKTEHDLQWGITQPSGAKAPMALPGPAQTRILAEIRQRSELALGLFIT